MSEYVKKEIKSWVITIVFALALALVINRFVIVNAKVPTGSMESTIMPKDRIVALRVSYLFSDPKRGDIVVFKYPDDPEQKVLYVKRVIGLPGDTVEVVDGEVFINGSEEPLNEVYLNEKPVGDFGPYNIPEDSYFMMGDNRNNSLDARYWTNKFVTKEKILGKVFFRYWPNVKLLNGTAEYK